MTSTLDINNFVDLKNLTIDKTKPTKERLEQFIEAVKNPYMVRVGETLVKIEFTDGRSFSDALTNAFLM